MDILSSLLSQKSAKQTDFEKVLWLVGIMKWIQRPRSADEKDTNAEKVYTTRLKYILMLLSRNPEWKENFISTMSSLLFHISSNTQFVNSGLPLFTSFIQEFFFRLQEKILPKTPLSEDLGALIYEIFPTEEESIFVDFIDEDVMRELVDLFQHETALHQKLKSDILSACYILSVKILNTTFVIQDDLKENVEKPEILNEFKVESILGHHQKNCDFNIPKQIMEEINYTESRLNALYKLMESRGVKIELVYHFQNQRRRINRIRGLLNFFNPEISVALNFRFFIAYLILDTYHKKSLKSFFSENLSLLTQRIVKANSHVGEHYVAFNNKQVRDMFRSAMGGGAVTALTVFIKVLLTKIQFFGLVKGVADSLNYSLSFLLIQICGWTLATKQPSATAPFIASALTQSVGESRSSIVALLRAQFIAVLGNLTLVFPICFFVSWAAFSLERPILSEQEALYVFYSSSLIGPSALYAVFTGFLLFVSSLMAGWFENWVIANRIGKRIKYNARIIGWIGEEKTKNLSNFISENSNGLAGNISLGIMLGMSPQILYFMNIPLDVRHVTLATGGLAASLPSVLISGVTAWDIANSALGILVIGIINISTSFALALLLASASSKIKMSVFMKLLKWGFRLLLTRPWLLFAPGKAKDFED